MNRKKQQKISLYVVDKRRHFSSDHIWVKKNQMAVNSLVQKVYIYMFVDLLNLSFCSSFIVVDY